MKKEINLVLRKQEVKKDIRKFFLLSIAIFAFVFFISIITVVYNLILNNELNSLQSKETNLKSSINLLSTKKSKIVLLQERLTSIDKIIKTRDDMNTRVNSVLNIIPDDISILNLDAEKENVFVRVSSDDLYAINLLMDKIYSGSTELKNTKRVDLGSFSFNSEKANYTLGLSFDFIK